MDSDEYTINPHLVHQASLKVNPLVTKPGCPECECIQLQAMLFVYTHDGTAFRGYMVFCLEEGHLVYWNTPDPLAP